MNAAPELVFDVSTIMAGDMVRPTGIHRVVFELAVELIELTQGRVEFTRFDAVTRLYRRVDHRALLDSVERLNAVESPQRSTGGSAVRPSGWLARVAYRAVGALQHRAPATARSLKQALAHARRVALAAISMVGALRSDRRRRSDIRTVGCHSVTWSQSTVYCSVGVDFAHNDLDHLRRCKESSGCTVALTVYDLIPVVHPEFATRDLSEYFASLLGLADVALVISEYTATDARAYVAELGIPCPRLSALPLSSSLVATPQVRPTALSASVEAQGFVLFVSSITLRKNHHLLFDVWTTMLDDMPLDRIPYLLVAGSRGSISEETMSRMQRDARLGRRVVHLEGLSDAEVAWLYAHCSFTVYPSLYEGWGLPVSESLDFGKMCVASDRSSLPEAGEGLAVHLDAIDRGPWRTAIEELWSDPAQRATREAGIAQRHRRVTPTETASALLDSLGRAHLRGV